MPSEGPISIFETIFEQKYRSEGGPSEGLAGVNLARGVRRRCFVLGVEKVEDGRDFFEDGVRLLRRWRATSSKIGRIIRSFESEDSSSKKSSSKMECNSLPDMPCMKRVYRDK